MQVDYTKDAVIKSAKGFALGRVHPTLGGFFRAVVYGNSTQSQSFATAELAEAHVRDHGRTVA